MIVEQYWDEIRSGLAQHGIPIRHFVLHADQATLRERILSDPVLGPSTFRLSYLEPYSEAARAWLLRQAEVIDTTQASPDVAARCIADTVLGRAQARD